jgi:carbamoyltransferase
LLADPRLPDIKDRVNEIKQRQKFRPFAPAVLAERAEEFFFFSHDLPHCSPYMQYVFGVRDDEGLPGISHVDGTARIQTVKQDEAPLMHEILTAWEARTGCPILLNTSLNIKGEPLVNSLEDAQRWEEKYRVKVF